MCWYLRRRSSLPHGRGPSTACCPEFEYFEGLDVTSQQEMLRGYFARIDMGVDEMNLAVGGGGDGAVTKVKFPHVPSLSPGSAFATAWGTYIRLQGELMVKVV